MLNLKENLLEYLEDLSFNQMKNLEYLDLTRNKLATLNQNTFTGLESLKELLLSYNPLKRIDPNTFKYLSIQSNLARVDLISNTESDWFVFDDQDLCTLSHFRCQTEINIDTDQRCNCFVKYLNEIGSSVARISGSASFTNSETDEDYNVFQPCTNQLDSTKLDTNEDDEENYVHNRDPALLTRSTKEQQNQLSCSRNILRKCYSNDLGRVVKTDGSDDHLFNHSCLYNRFFAQRNKPSVNSGLINVLTSSIGLLSNKNLANDDFKSTQVVLLNGEESASSLSSTNSDDEATNQKSRKSDKFTFNSLLNLADSNAIDNTTKYTVEKNLFYLLVGLLVVFIISICSLLMSIYLLIKRNTFIYQTAGSGYPVDER